jgi:hypothetical protein
VEKKRRKHQRRKKKRMNRDKIKKLLNERFDFSSLEMELTTIPDAAHGQAWLEDDKNILEKNYKSIAFAMHTITMLSEDPNFSKLKRLERSILRQLEEFSSIAKTVKA